MIDKLIEEGKSLENKASDSMVGKYFKSVDFESWVSKSVLFLEENHSKSTLTEKAKEGYKEMTQNNNFDYYQFLLGTLIAIKEY